MKKSIIAAFIAALYLLPVAAFAVSVSWDRPATGRINPVNILDTVYANKFIATSTTAASTFTYASTTELSWTATSTGSKGISLSGGCFAISGTCITSGSGSSASSTLLTDNNTFAGSNIFSATTSIAALQMNNTGDHVIGITAARDYPASISTGGLVNITNTNNAGAGLVLFTNHAGSETGRLLEVNCNSTSFAQDCSHVDYNGTQTAFSVTASQATTKNALSFTAGGTGYALLGTYTGVAGTGAASFSSTATTTVLNVIGTTTGQGVIKATHTGGPSDSNAAVLSLDSATSSNPASGGTAAQILFLNSTGSTTGNIITGRNNSTDFFTVNSVGWTGIASSTPGSPLAVQNVANFTGATSTFYSTGGINLTSGCFAVAGTCVGGSSLATPVSAANGGTGTSTWQTDSIPFFNGTRFTEDNRPSSVFGYDNSLHILFTPNLHVTGLATLFGEDLTEVDTSGTINQVTVSSPLALSGGVLTLGTVTTAKGGTGTTTWQTSSIPYFNGTRLTENNFGLNWNNGGQTLNAANIASAGLISTVTFSATAASTTHLTAATSLGIPTSSNPSPVSAGYISESSNSPFQLHVGNGGATTIFDPRPAFILTVSSTTVLSGTTTAPAFVFPMGMTVTNWRCTVQPNGAAAEIAWQYANGSAYATVGPTYLAASTTPGLETISSNNTPTAGATSTLAVGSPSGSAISASCSFYGNATAI